jgi:hypothetical protein
MPQLPERLRLEGLGNRLFPDLRAERSAFSNFRFQQPDDIERRLFSAKTGSIPQITPTIVAFTPFVRRIGSNACARSR